MIVRWLIFQSSPAACAADPHGSDEKFPPLGSDRQKRKRISGKQPLQMSLKSLGLHPDFPTSIWVVVEQPSHEPMRIAYDAFQNKFRRTEHKSLMYVRGFSGAYGWIGGLGTPPDPHCDVILISDRNHQCGDIIPARVCGIFYRRDEDHKIIALDIEMSKVISNYDLFSIDEERYNEITGIYPEVAEGEGWYGAQEALRYLGGKVQEKE